MEWRLANSLTKLRNQYNALHPERSKLSDGTIGDPAHAATRSEHNPNIAGVVTAMDITHDPSHGADMNILAEQLIEDPRTWYVIFNGRIRVRGQSWQPYSGANDHSKHLHISVAQTSHVYDDPIEWKLNNEEDLTVGQADELYKKLHETNQRIDQIAVILTDLHTIVKDVTDALKIEDKSINQRLHQSNQRIDNLEEK